MAEKKFPCEAIDIKKSVVVARLGGGSTIPQVGDVLIVGSEVSEQDAAYLIGSGKARGCSVDLKAKRAAEKAK